MPTLDWLNRAEAFNISARVPYRLLEPVSSHGTGADNTDPDSRGPGWHKTVPSVVLAGFSHRRIVHSGATAQVARRPRKRSRYLPRKSGVRLAMNAATPSR